MSSPTAAPLPLPASGAKAGFGEASAAVVDYLKAVLPMAFWAVTRFDGERQLYLEVRDDFFGTTAGDSHPWQDSFCINMVAGRTPRIAPDARSVPEYAGPALQHNIGSYVGIPIVRADGQLFGTLCGLDSEPRDDSILDQAPLLDVLGMLLSTILEADLQYTESVRQLERARRAAEVDQLTGLLNRHGWDRLIELEEARYRRFGDPVAVIMIDLDRLKEINDTHGHASGDHYIKLAARVLEATVRDTDVLARLGGDEFGIIAGNVLPVECERLVDRIMAGFAEVGVVGSIGHAPFTVDAGFAGALAAADASMYDHKRLQQRQLQRPTIVERPCERPSTPDQRMPA